MGIFSGSKGKAKGKAFTLEETGISGTVYPLAPSTVRNALKRLQSSSELQLVAQGNFMALLDTAPEAVAALIAEATREDSSDPSVIADILDLPLGDFRDLMVLSIDATLKGKAPKDFFGELIERLGLNGISIEQQPAADSSQQQEMFGAIQSIPGNPIPADLASEIRGE